MRVHLIFYRTLAFEKDIFIVFDLRDKILIIDYENHVKLQIKLETFV